MNTNKIEDLLPTKYWPELIFSIDDSLDTKHDSLDTETEEVELPQYIALMKKKHDLTLELNKLNDVNRDLKNELPVWKEKYSKLEDLRINLINDLKEKDEKIKEIESKEWEYKKRIKKLKMEAKSSRVNLNNSQRKFNDEHEKVLRLETQVENLTASNQFLHKEAKLKEKMKSNHRLNSDTQRIEINKMIKVIDDQKNEIENYKTHLKNSDDVIKSHDKKFLNLEELFVRKTKILNEAQEGKKKVINELINAQKELVAVQNNCLLTENKKKRMEGAIKYFGEQDEISQRKFYKLKFQLASVKANFHAYTIKTKKCNFGNGTKTLEPRLIQRLREKNVKQRNKNDKLKLTIQKMQGLSIFARQKLTLCQKEHEDRDHKTIDYSIENQLRFVEQISLLKSKLSAAMVRLEAQYEKGLTLDKSLKNMKQLNQTLTKENLDFQEYEIKNTRLVSASQEMKCNIDMKNQQIKKITFDNNKLKDENEQLIKKNQLLHDHKISTQKTNEAEILKYKEKIIIKDNKTKELLNEIKKCKDSLTVFRCQNEVNKIMLLKDKMAKKEEVFNEQLRTEKAHSNELKGQNYLMSVQLENEMKRTSRQTRLITRLEHKVLTLKISKAGKTFDIEGAKLMPELKTLRKQKTDNWNIIKDLRMENKILKTTIKESTNINPRVKWEIVNNKIPNKQFYKT